MKNDFEIYFRFLRFSLGLDEGKEFLDGSAFGDDVCDGKGFDWKELYAFAKKQSLIGVLFDGIQKLPQGVRLGEDLTMTWVGMSQKIKRRNVLLNQASAYIYNKVKAAGYRCCILKGQGNALMYPNPSSRTPGDVDVWVNANREEIRRLAVELADGKGTVGKESLNHIEMSVNGIAVELHSTPAILNNPLYDRRLQKWLRKNADLQCSNVVSLPGGVGEMAIPTNAFNVVYQLFHLFHHYLFEGIGLRQFVDFYFVVDKWHTDHMKLTDLAALQREVKWLGLWKFAGAVMYVLHEALGLDEDKMIVSMDERRGRLLLDEILAGGNFGKHAAKNHSGSMTWRHNFYRLQKDWKLMRYYPSECMAEPFYRLCHFLWRNSVWK